jgi:ferredoxin
MAAYITEDCIHCEACVSECPTGAISEGDEISVIDPALCTECVGFYSYYACQVVCLPRCCLPNPEIPETESVLIDRISRRTTPARIGAGRTALEEAMA